jgi:hypothetical protein
MHAGTSLWWRAGVRRRSLDVTCGTAVIPHAQRESLSSPPLLTPPSRDTAGSQFYLARIFGHFADRVNMASYSVAIIAIPIRRESESPALSQCRSPAVNPSSTDWVQNLSTRGIFLNNSRWYRVTILPNFYLFIELPLTQRLITLHIYCFLRMACIFWNPNGPFCLYPWKKLYLSNS